MAFMDPDWIDRLSGNLSELIKLVTHSEIAFTEKKLVIDKRQYGMMSPHKEYNTVTSGSSKVILIFLDLCSLCLKICFSLLFLLVFCTFILLEAVFLNRVKRR